MLRPHILAAAAFCACIAGIAQPAFAEDYQPVHLTAAQILEKADAAYGRLPAGRYRETEQVRQGDVTWNVVTLRDGKDYRVDSSGAGFTYSYGRKGQDVWKADENGIVTILSNAHALNPNRVAWRNAGDNNGAIKVLGSLNGDIVLEANPRGGSDQYRYYDAKTFLLHRVVTFSKDRYRHVTEYNDYRNVFGLMEPFRITSSDGRSRNDSVDTVASYERADTVDTSIPPSPPLFQLAPDVATELPATFTQDGVVVRATIAGKGYDFLLDSGEAGMSIDPGVAASLGLKEVAKTTETIGGDYDTGLVRIAEMHVGPLTLHNVAFSTVPLNDQVGAHRVVGLIGFDFLVNGITKFDFVRRKVAMYSPLTFNPDTLGLAKMPAAYDDGVPMIPVWTENVKGNFLLDTGAFATVAYKNYTDRLPDKRRDGNITMTAVGGDVPSTFVVAHDMIFGTTRFETVNFIQPSVSRFDFDDYDGIIGRDAMSGFEVYLDYVDGLVFTKYTKR